LLKLADELADKDEMLYDQMLFEIVYQKRYNEIVYKKRHKLVKNAISSRKLVS
jgi:hypothetical protein